MNPARAVAPLLLLALAGCSDGPAAPVAPGYVEGDFVLVGAEAAGRLVALDVRKGDAVEAGAPLFALDDRDETAALDEAKAQEQAAAAQLADLRTGRRAEEIRVLDAQLAEAEAQFAAAQKAYDRSLTLSDRAVTSAATLDQAKAALDAASARVEAARQNRAVGELAARPEAIRAAEQALAARGAAVEAAETRLDWRARSAPAAGLVEDVFYRLGEIVPAGGAVVSLLPPENRKILFFVPEPLRASLRPGASVTLACDGCPAGLAAKVTWIASEAEFAPPVIYSTESRVRLVFRVEARPEGAALALAPGQPVDVSLAPPR